MVFAEYTLFQAWSTPHSFIFGIDRLINVQIPFLIVNGNVLTVVHVFLTARSPVFNAMFEHEMEESKKVR